MVAVLSVLLSASCEEEPARGAAGESCTRRADCADGLMCFGGICASPAPDGGASQGAPPAAEGGACEARVDCQDGLVCTANRCAQAAIGVDPDSRYGGRGESCQAKNDCEQDLACVSNACREVTLSLSHTEKDCYRVECGQAADCCEGFVPNENCAAYQANCETDPIFCNTYRTLCECAEECVDEVCVAAAQGCATDAECTSVQTPFCVDTRCSQCGEDADCAGAGTQCVAGVCMAACAIDENCPLLHACQDSVCVDVGCTTDRECVFVTALKRAAWTATAVALQRRPDCASTWKARSLPIARAALRCSWLRELRRVPRPFALSSSQKRSSRLSVAVCL